MPDPATPRPPGKRGRAAGFNTPNRFEPLHLEPDPAEPGDEGFEERVPTQYLIDASRSILAENDSPDVGFRFSLNPYRGCEHGCVYCYARPTHEYLGFSAGLDFETRILVKEQAPELLEAALRKRSWQPQVVALSGNTDCYQPVERRLQLTRRCLEVFLRFRNPVSLITKNHLVTRDLDILESMAALDLVHVTLSITSLDRRLTAAMEPRTSRPERRLQALGGAVPGRGAGGGQRGAPDPRASTTPRPRPSSRRRRRGGRAGPTTSWCACPGPCGPCSSTGSSATTPTGPARSCTGSRRCGGANSPTPATATACAARGSWRSW